MKWEHACSLEWLKKRQDYLCASEVKKLIPYTKTGRTRKVTDMDRLAVWADKQKHLDADDCMSYGPAARGHILEPYAINAFNVHSVKMGWGVELYYWDDIIVNIPSVSPWLAYSPDALNVPPDVSSGKVLSENLAEGSILGEVKSYGADKHLQCMATNQMELEERWQIATAMAADPNIKQAYLIFYNPSLDGDYQLGIFHYERYMLAAEIGIIDNVADDWDDFVCTNVITMFSAIRGVSPYSEEEIIDMLEAEKSALNPCA